MTRERYYKGMGLALETQGSNGKWYHMCWIKGPCAIAQKLLRKGS